MRTAIVYTGAALYFAVGAYAIETAANETSDWYWKAAEQMEARDRWVEDRVLVDEYGHEIDTDEDPDELVESGEAYWDTEQPDNSMLEELGYE